MAIKTPPRRRGCLIFGLVGLITFFVVICGLFAAVSLKPAFAAEGADLLRTVFGDEAVAKLEQAVFKVQDTFQRLEYNLGVKHAEVPWQPATEPAASAIEYPSTSISNP